MCRRVTNPLNMYLATVQIYPMLTSPTYMQQSTTILSCTAKCKDKVLKGGVNVAPVYQSGRCINCPTHFANLQNGCHFINPRVQHLEIGLHILSNNWHRTIKNRANTLLDTCACKLYACLIYKLSADVNLKINHPDGPKIWCEGGVNDT